jgi:hypothetical protein
MGDRANIRGVGRAYGLTFSRDRSYLIAKKRIFKARKCPVYECLINPNWQDDGLANILLSRKQPDNNIIFGCFLVDTFCLGLKDSFCNVGLSLSEYEDDLKISVFKEGEPIDCSVTLIHQIIFGAIQYAANLGFKPNKNYSLSKFILEDESDYLELLTLEFGKDGKPFYIPDSYDPSNSIIKQLENKLGKGNFDFMKEV